MLLPFFWMIKFSGVLHDRKGELMILNSNADKNEASTVKGGASVWKEWLGKAAVSMQGGDQP